MTKKASKQEQEEMHHLFLLAATVVFCAFITFLIQARTRRGLVLPPGPNGILLIGSLHGFVSSFPHLYLHQLSKKYGPLMHLKLGFVPTLVVSSAKMAKEVMKTHDQTFSSRPNFTAMKKLSYNGSDIAFAPYGDAWREIRRIVVLHFFCSKKVDSFAMIREEEVQGMMNTILEVSNYEGKLVNLSEMMMKLTSSIVCRSAFGRGYDRCNESSVVGILREAQELFVTFFFGDYFPFLGWIDKLKGMSSRLEKLFMELDGFYEDIIDGHVKKKVRYEEEDDIVDVLLKLQKERSLGITMDNIKGVLMNIFAAGTDTSAATLIWAMTELIKNPHTMKRVQDETRTFARNKGMKSIVIQEQDVEMLPYLKAVVKETMRLHPTSPLLVPRQTIQKCNIQGYEIPAKTLVFVNMWAIGRDPECWESPEEFNPERFLGDDKKVVDFRGQHFELIPFGSGRRICPGIQMAVSMVQLALANLVCGFNWILPKEKAIDMSVLPGITPHKKHPLCLVAKEVQVGQN